MSAPSKGSGGWTDPSSIPPDVARKILAVRDALIKDDTNEAWHRLYSIADPTMRSFKPWQELEKQSNKATTTRTCDMSAPTPLTFHELLELALAGKPIPADRVLATFADTKNWIQIYDGVTTSDLYKAKACEWAFVGPMRPPFELAQHALESLKTIS